MSSGSLMRTPYVLEPGGCPAFRSHSNSNVLDPPGSEAGPQVPARLLSAQGWRVRRRPLRPCTVTQPARCAHVADEHTHTNLDPWPRGPGVACSRAEGAHFIAGRSRCRTIQASAPSSLAWTESSTATRPVSGNRPPRHQRDDPTLPSLPTCRLFSCVLRY